MTIAWSCGGGIQSVAIGVLVGEGVLPVPDLAAIVDTGREVQSTWDYLDNYLNPHLRAKRGFEVEIVPHTFARVDLFDKSGLTLIPAYTAEGRLSAFCSGEWKRDRKRLETWKDFWIENVLSTTAMTEEDREACRAAVLGMYAAAGLPAPKRIVFVPSPFALRFAGGFAAAIWCRHDQGNATRKMNSLSYTAAVADRRQALGPLSRPLS
jgi:hypothetical protein